MTKMSSKKNGNASARREKKMGGGNAAMMRKPMPHGGKHTKGYARGGVVNPSYSGDMPQATPN